MIAAAASSSSSSAGGGGGGGGGEGFVVQFECLRGRQSLPKGRLKLLTLQGFKQDGRIRTVPVFFILLCW